MEDSDYIMNKLVYNCFVFVKPFEYITVYFLILFLDPVSAGNSGKIAARDSFVDTLSMVNFKVVSVFTV